MCAIRRVVAGLFVIALAACAAPVKPVAPAEPGQPVAASGPARPLASAASPPHDPAAPAAQRAAPTVAPPAQPATPAGPASSTPAPPTDEHAAVVAYQAKDYPQFLRHMRALAAREPTLPRVIYKLAAAEALAGSADAAIALLRQLAATGLAFAIEHDEDFGALHGRDDFQAAVRALQHNLAPRGHAASAFTLRERDLIAEGVAYDPVSRRFFVSSVRRRKIIALDAQFRARDFVPEASDGIGGVFGLAVDASRRVLWAASADVPHMIGAAPADRAGSALVKYDLATGKRLATYPVPRDGRPHALGDVIVAPNGDAYTTDSASPTIYRVAAARDQLEVVTEGGFRSLQGLALSADGATLYVADYGLGLYALRLADRQWTRLAPAPGIAVTGIDGLYLYRGQLIATQNGGEPHRVLALGLDAGGARIVRQQILLSGDPRASDLALGVIVGDALYLNAASGWAYYNDDGVPNDGRAPPPHAFLRVPLP